MRAERISEPAEVEEVRQALECARARPRS
jgi:hypothetical protein